MERLVTPGVGSDPAWLNVFMFAKNSTYSIVVHYIIYRHTYVCAVYISPLVLGVFKTLNRESPSPPGPMYRLTLAVCCVVSQENLPLVKLLRLLVLIVSIDVFPLRI